jgi:uncharacterized protein DUF1844
VSDKQIKVTDKRIFTPGGDLKEEYRFLEENATEAPEATPASTATAPAQAPAAPAGDTAPRRSSSDPRRPSPSDRPSDRPAEREPPFPPSAGPELPPLEIPGSPPGLGAPTFYDLAAMLAEQAALYLGDLATEEGPIPENLELARLHIDLLDLLRQKTAGNLTAQEAAFLEDLLYRLRVRYVQKRG